MQPADPDIPGRILILAPTGRDAAELERVLDGIGVPTRVLASFTALCSSLKPDEAIHVAALFITEEALAGGAEALATCLERQPPWSDIPIVILTAGGGRRGSWARWARFKALGNVTLLDRPLHAEVLQSAARASLRARARQHQTRQHLEALRLATETLEARVEERSRELMVLQETLHQAQKMEAIGQLTGGLAHDFNNLLTAISGGAESLQRLLATIPLSGHEARIDRALRMITQGADRAAALTHRLLAFSRRQTLDPRPTDVRQLIAGMEDLIRRTMGPAIAIRVIEASDLKATLVDPHQLESALLNLCINARDAMPEGGDLCIETTSTAVDEATARSWDIVSGSYVVIGVTDTGTGMPPDVLARAFEPFFTTKPIGQGTGLGLSMVYGFAQQSGGRVEIASQVGRGTTVRIMLPQYGGIVADDQTQDPSVLPRSESAETVLVVDDEPMVRMLVSDVLTEMGYRVLEAGDGASGLKILRSDARIDLLISDVGLPGGMNGRQMVDAARETRPWLKTLFITGYAETAVLSHGNLEPGMHVLTKPFTMDGLVQRIQVVLRE